MLRLPTLAEIYGLFFTPTKVAHAIGGIERAATGAAHVATHRQKAALRSMDAAGFHWDEAGRHDDLATDHLAEADRARRVAGKLQELVA